jgi:hypothetical protein
MDAAGRAADGGEIVSYHATSAINQALEAVIGLMNGTQPFATVTRGALPTGPGIVAEIGPSVPRDMYMTKNTTVPLDVTINAKNHSLLTLGDALNKIHSALTRATVYPYAQNWQIVDIKTASEPQIIGREDNNDWIMASSLTVEIFLKGD